MTQVTSAKGAHLVGSVPLESVEAVFLTSVRELGGHLERLPDGELGARSIWIAWQRDVFSKLDGFDEVPPAPGSYVSRPLLRARPNVTAADLSLGPLGYAQAAKESYAVFERLKKAGELPEPLRFQVGLPTPMEPVIGMFTVESQSVIAPVYERSLLRELDEILEAIPHEQLAIQFETVYLLGVLEGVWKTGIEKSSIPARIAALADLVPNTVPVGYHLCYGDSGHRHFKQPESTRIMVDVANGILESAGRSIDWFHMPVPKNRTDDAYFEPLSELRRPETTALYLGLVHATDGEVGSRARIATASRHTQRFGVATECGLGRRPPETIPELLRIHESVSAAV